jgi:hypothetical protein
LRVRGARTGIGMWQGRVVVVRRIAVVHVIGIH